MFTIMHLHYRNLSRDHQNHPDFLHFGYLRLNPFLPTEHRGTIGTFERIPEYIIADYPMVAKLSPRTIGRSPRVDSPLKSTQNFGL